MCDAFLTRTESPMFFLERKPYDNFRRNKKNKH